MRHLLTTPTREGARFDRVCMQHEPARKEQLLPGPVLNQPNDPARAGDLIVMSYSDVLGTIWRCATWGTNDRDGLIHMPAFRRAKAPN
jgi:hypothetical protein